MHSLIIDGRDVPGEGALFESRDPADERLVWQASGASQRQAVDAVEAALRALAEWRGRTLEERAECMRRYGQSLEREQDQLARLITRESGKLPSEARGEVKTSIAKVELTIAAANERRASASAAQGSAVAEIQHRPLGVVVVLGPFNFPSHLPGGQIIPALLAGNTVVFKPSERTPAVGAWIADAWRRAGLPAGVLNLVQGGADIAGTLIDHPEVRGVMFTGSYRAGASIHRRLAGRPEVLLALEMGGNSPLVAVAPLDTLLAAEVIVASAYITAGQRCTCARRLVVVDDATGQDLVQTLVDFVRRVPVGLAGDDPEPFVGPLVSAEAANGIFAAYEDLLARGGRPLVPMQRSPRSRALLTPALVDMTEATEPVEDEEHFGPLLQLYRVPDFETAVRRAGQTRFGLAAALVGGTRDQFERFRATVPAGVVNWNRQTTGASGTLPFGGLGHSGNHRPAGYWAIDACSDPIASLLTPTLEKGDAPLFGNLGDPRSL